MFHDPRPRVLVVEGDPALLLAITEALRGDGLCVSGITDGVPIATLSSGLEPQVAIIDLQVATGPDDHDVAERVRTLTGASVLFLTTADHEEDVLARLVAPGDDYVLKPFPMWELLARVRVLQRRRQMRCAHRAVGDLVLDPATSRVTWEGAVIALSHTEYALLDVLTQKVGQVVSKRELLQRVWGFGTGNTHVVEVHVSALRRKLEAHGPRLIRTVRGQGYVVQPPLARAARRAADPYPDVPVPALLH